MLAHRTAHTRGRDGKHRTGRERTKPGKEQCTVDISLFHTLGKESSAQAPKLSAWELEQPQVNLLAQTGAGGTSSTSCHQQGLQEGTQRTNSGAGSWSRGYQGLVLDKDLQMELSSQMSQWAKPAAYTDWFQTKSCLLSNLSSTADCAPSSYRDLVEEEKGDITISPPALLHAHTILSRTAMGTNAGSSPTSQLQPTCSLCCPGIWRSVDSLCHFCTEICCSSQGRDFRSGNSPQFGQEDNSKKVKIPLHMLMSRGWVCGFLEDCETSDWSREFKGILTASPPVWNLGQTSSMFL